MAQSLPHLEKRRRVWFARLRVPADVADIIGRRVLIQTTGETDQSVAALRAAPIIKAWKEQIEAARRGQLSELDAQVNSLAASFRRAHHPDLKDSVLEDAIRFVVERIGGKDAAQVHALVSEQATDRYDAVAQVAGRKATETLDIITGDATPWLAHYEAWKASGGLKGRTLAQCASDVKEAALGPVEAITGDVVQQWVNRQNGAARATIVRKMSALRNYWRYLQAQGVAPRASDPFKGLILPRKDKDRLVRKEFGPADVVRLWKASTGTLSDLLWLAAHTGARIEELCSIRVEHVRAGAVEIVDSKTQKGIRTVPIHSAVQPLVDALLKSSKDGYLIPSTANNQHNERSAALSKAFGRLKTGLGYGPEFVFHSLRKTVATLLQDAGCPEPTAADILGHEITTMSYGVYSGGTSMKTRAEWLERAVRYPG